MQEQQAVDRKDLATLAAASGIDVPPGLWSRWLSIWKCCASGTRS